LLILTPKKRHRKENIKSPRKYLGDMSLDNYRCDASMATEIFDVTIEHGSEDDPTKDEWSEDSL